MCDNCQQLESTIKRYRRLVAQCFDSITVDRVNELIRELQTRKDAMHR
jgi:hypothetical protein